MASQGGQLTFMKIDYNNNAEATESQGQRSNGYSSQPQYSNSANFGKATRVEGSPPNSNSIVCERE